MTSDTAAALLSRAILAHENPHIDTTKNFFDPLLQRLSLSPIKDGLLRYGEDCGWETCTGIVMIQAS